MTDTTVSTRARAKQWDSDFFREYVRGSIYKRYMGGNENAVIQVNNDLTKKKGDAITFNLVGAIDATAGYNTGATQLVGNEKAVPNDGWQVSIGVVRDAVRTNVLEEQASAFDLREAARVQLKELSQRYLRDDINRALGSVNGVAYATATAAQKNAWTAANSDRVLFGNAIANYSATHATALGAITDEMTLSTSVVSLAKRIARSAKTVNGEGIRPVRFDEDEEFFVMFTGTKAFRDLRADMVANKYWQEALERSKSNPLFTSTGSILWDNVLVREIPSLADIGTVGAESANVVPYYLCGAQAIGLSWARTTQTTIAKEDDYGFKNGVGFMELRGLGKIQYGQGEVGAKDWGVMTGFVAAAADQ